MKKNIFCIIAVLSISIFFSSCAQNNCNLTKTNIMKKSFGKLKNGQEIDLYSLENKNGLKTEIINFGARQVSLLVPDKNENFKDILLGFDKISDYENENPYFSAIIGRYGNRIGKGKFSIDGKEFSLACNNDENHLHGGVKGFDSVVWDFVSSEENENGASIKFSYLSKDGEEGYPGNLKVFVTYTLSNDDELIISYKATTDKKTICNLTQHNYHNLSGHDSGKILSHQLMINADNFTPIDKGLIPTGEIKPVKGTNFDFTKPTAIGERVNNKSEQLVFGKGYDHNFVLNKNGKEGKMTLAASVFDPKSGRVMDVFTEEPGVQFYSGNFLDGTNVGKDGTVYNQRNAFCLETQHYPDSPNKPNFPTVILNPGEEYSTKTIYKFSAK